MFFICILRLITKNHIRPQIHRFKTMATTNTTTNTTNASGAQEAKSATFSELATSESEKKLDESSKPCGGNSGHLEGFSSRFLSFVFSRTRASVRSESSPFRAVPHSIQAHLGDGKS